MHRTGIVVAFAWFLGLAAVAGAQEEKDVDAIAKQHLDVAQRALSDGDNAKAIDELQASLAAKQTAKAYFLLGNTYVKIGALDDAKVAFDEYLKLDPKSKNATKVKSILDDIAQASKTKLQIQSNPPGATVYLDLKATGSRGRTPITLVVDPGKHRVFFDAEGFEPVIESVVAEENKVTPVSVTLEPKGCDFAISSTPPATVRIDDGAPKTTPVTIRVPLGPHRVEFSGEGLAPKTKSAECKNYASQVISEFLEKMPNGWLAMSLPAGASASIDGKNVDGDKLAKLELPPGIHTVDVTAPGKAPWHVTTKIRAGMETDLSPRLDVGGLTLGKGTTGIEVVADQRANVRLDGNEIRPMEPISATAGQHTLEVDLAGSKPYRSQVHITQGGIAVVNPALEKPSNFPLYGALVLVAAAGATTGIAIWGGQNREVMDVQQGAFVATGALGVLAVGALTYWIIDRRSSTSKESAAHVSAVVSPAGASAMVSGHF